MQIDPKVLVETFEVVMCTGSLWKYLMTCHFIGKLDRQHAL